jgi:hypothetical protein
MLYSINCGTIEPTQKEKILSNSYCSQQKAEVFLLEIKGLTITGKPQKRKLI